MFAFDRSTTLVMTSRISQRFSGRATFPQIFLQGPSFALFPCPQPGRICGPLPITDLQLPTSGPAAEAPMFARADWADLANHAAGSPRALPYC